LATVSKPEGFLIDETYEKLGTAMQIAPLLDGVEDTGVLVLVVATALSGSDLYQRSLVSGEKNRKP